ncbi:hypothetical protein N2152v2_007080 [Parachlorella kessleri]
MSGEPTLTGSKPYALITLNTTSGAPVLLRAALLLLAVAACVAAGVALGLSYSTDALSLVLALHRTTEVARERLWLTQHGTWGPRGSGNTLGEVLKVGPSIRSTVLDLMSQPRPPALVGTSIVICHSPAGCWSTPEPDTPLFRAGESPCPREKSAYFIGRTMWESDRLLPGWVPHLNATDELWVPAEHTRQLFRREGVVRPKIHLVPVIIETDLWDPGKHSPLPLSRANLVLGSGPRVLAEKGDRPFLFFSTFTWEKRKGYDVLLRAYLEEFRVDSDGQQQQEGQQAQQAKQQGQGHQGQRMPRPRVALLVKALPFGKEEGFNSTHRIRSWVAAELGIAAADFSTLPPVYDFQEYLPYKVLPRLFKAADGFVFPTRGEGWGLPIVEAMSMGLPVIATNWSAPVDYLDDSVAFPLAAQGMEQDGSQPSVQHLRRLMRQVVEHPGEARRRGQAARVRMVTRYSPSAVGRTVAVRLKQIDQELSQRAPVPES